MKKALGKILALILVLTGSIGMLPTTYAAESKARLYNVYSDGMLFQQKKDAILAGTGTPGDTISCKLIDGSKTVKSASGKVAPDGTFEISFVAPKGAFKEYKIKMYKNGKLFQTLNDVVFGELWLAGGQSNMELMLIRTVNGQEMYDNNVQFSKWLRFLEMPIRVEYKGALNNYAAYPQNEIPGCKWVKGDGDRNDVYLLSAVALYFSQSLMKKLQMPVGALCSYLGGTSIITWLPRNSIENNKSVKTVLGKEYRKPSFKCPKGTETAEGYMSHNFNTKTAALKNFRPVGMIWYQGEADLGRNEKNYGFYKKMFLLLQDSYSELFGFGDRKMPIIFTQLASYAASTQGNNIQQMNVHFSEIQRSRPKSLALMSIYDLPLTYNPSYHAIHPTDKAPVAQRMYETALSFVYGLSDKPYTAATVSSYKFDGDKVYVTFRDTGDGLKAKGKSLEGFSLCSKNGIYLPAEAKIVSKNKIVVTAENVKNPVSISYACAEMNARSNLYSTKNGEYVMPVSPFVSDKTARKKAWKDSAWTDCDSSSIWRLHFNEYTGFYDVWTSKNAKIAIEEDSAYKGSDGLHIISKLPGIAFSVSPLMRYKNKSTKQTERFIDVESDFSHYSAISFRVRNNGKKDVKFSEMKIYTDKKTFYCPVVKGTTSLETSIPADGKWHKITLDLNKLYRSGKVGAISFSRNILNDIYNIDFCFKNAVANRANIDVDEFQFTATTAKKADYTVDGSVKMKLWDKKLLKSLEG